VAAERQRSGHVQHLPQPRDGAGTADHPAGGRDAFYKGPIARAIVRKSREVGGAIRLDDLAEYPEAEWSTPLSTNYHGYDIHQLPPPGQGFAALEMLNILEVCAPRLGANLAQLPARPKVLAPHDRSQEARLLGPAPVQR
jgi:gamma-glutamyltranspeptidase